MPKVRRSGRKVQLQKLLKKQYQTAEYEPFLEFIGSYALPQVISNENLNINIRISEMPVITKPTTPAPEYKLTPIEYVITRAPLASIPLNDPRRQAYEANNDNGN